MRLCYFLVFVLLACVEPQRTFSTPKATKPAKLEVKGYGLLGNWRLKRMLRDVELGGKKPEFFAPTFIEDSALLLTSRVKEDGYRTPVIRISIELAGGEKITLGEKTIKEIEKIKVITWIDLTLRFRKQQHVLLHFHEHSYKTGYNLRYDNSCWCKKHFQKNAASPPIKRHHVQLHSPDAE